MPIELHAHQSTGVENMHNGCILYGGVGVGKTITSLAYYFVKVCGGELNKWGSMKTPKRLVVVTTAKVRDSKAFELQAAQMGIHADPELSTNGVSIEVTSWNKITDYVGVKDAFFIFDEQRVVGYGAWSRAFIKIARDNEWIMLSATPGDTWLDYIPVFIANGWYKHKTDFTDQHVVWTPRVKYPKVLRYMDIGTLVRRRNEVLVHMPYERHTTRHQHYLICDYDEVAFQKVTQKRWHVYEHRPLRDPAEMFSVARRVVNSDLSRLEALRKLLEKHPRLIVFYNFDYELEMLRSLGVTTAFESTTTASTPPISPSAQAAESDSVSTSYSLSSTTPGHTTTTRSSTSTTSPSNSSMVVSHSCPPWETTPEIMAECAGCAGESGEPIEKENETCLTNSASTTNRVDSTSTKNAASPHKERSSNTSSASSPTTSGSGSSDSTGATNHSCPEIRANCEGFTVTPAAVTFEENSATSVKAASVVGTSDSTTCASTTERTSSSVDATAVVSGERFSIAEWNGHKHEEIPATERWLYLVQYRAGAEGWNCIETDAVVLWSQTYSYRDDQQVLGRIDRLNTPFTDLHYYRFVSNSAIDKGIRGALKAKKNFNERDLVL